MNSKARHHGGHEFVVLSVDPFNQKGYLYKGESLWEQATGKLSIRIHRRTYRGTQELYVTIRVTDSRVPSNAVSRIRIYLANHPERKAQFTNKGEARLPYIEGEQSRVILESDPPSRADGS